MNEIAMSDTPSNLRAASMPEPGIEYVHVEKVDMTFQTKRGPFAALREIDLSVQKGEFIALIGHSGCGKTTLLNLVAGLIEPTSGVLLCAGREIAGPGPERAVVFQNHSLLPWLSCFDNVYMAVERVFAATEKKADLKRRTHEALAMQPKVLLLDEPFGALDALTRARLQDELTRIVQAAGSTVLMVTHDVDEAVLLADRIVMMTNGPAATIGDIVAVDLPRPRDRVALAKDPRYHALRSVVLEFLYRRQHAPEEQAA